MSYYDDLSIQVAVQHFFLYDNIVPFVAETNSIEFIRKGQVTLECDGKIIELTAPAIFWMRAGRHYRFELPAGNNAKCEHFYFDFFGPRSDRMVAELEQLAPRGVIVPRDSARCEELFFKILRSYRTDPVGNHPEIVVTIEELLLLAVESTRPRAPLVDDPYHLDKLAEKIRANPFKEYDFHAIALQSGISYPHFRRLFGLRFKTPLKNYVFQQKMILVAEMLAKTDMRIKEIMTAAAFDSMMNFSRSFKRFSGLSPQAYRKKFR